MTTLATIRNSVLSKLDDGSIERPTPAQVDAQINSVIRAYSTRNFWFIEDVATLVCTIDNPVLSGVPSDYNQSVTPNTLTLIDNDIRYPLTFIQPLAYDSMFANAKGRPSYFTYRNGQFELYFIPIQAYEIKLNYRKTYADLVNDDDSNDFTVNCERLIELKTLSDVLLDYRENTERGVLYAERAQAEFDNVQRNTDGRQASGRLQIENILNDGIYYNQVN